MIIVKITDGLGNQMFQYALARRIAYLQGEPLKMDLSWFDMKIRPFGLNHFYIATDIASPGESELIKSIRHVREPYFHFFPDVLQLKPSFYLEGYWQSERYFSEIAGLIRSEFMLKTGLEGKNAEMAGLINNTQSVALHIRRGDYVSDTVHNVCPSDYYGRAIAELTKTVENPHFFVFSNDWDWVRANLRMEYPVTLVMLNGEDQAHEDLRLMSLCKHHIIANSTFSWWGAWLAYHPQKKVYAPRQWFLQAQHNTDDLIPRSWCLI